MRVPEDQRTPGPHEVQVRVPVGVDDLRATRALEEERSTPHRRPGAHGAVHPAGNHAARFGEESLGVVRHLRKP